MAVKVGVEAWSAALPEMEELFPLHWKEIAINQHAISLDMDKERYAGLEKLGVIHLVVARAEERLVGYIIAFVMPHFHYRSFGPMAMTDMYYVLPEFRNGAGVKLFKEFERTLRDRGVGQMISSCKCHQDHQRFFELLGWTWTDKTFVKLLR